MIQRAFAPAFHSQFEPVNKRALARSWPACSLSNWCYHRYRISGTVSVHICLMIINCFAVHSAPGSSSVSFLLFRCSSSHTLKLWESHRLCCNSEAPERTALAAVLITLFTLWRFLVYNQISLPLSLRFLFTDWELLDRCSSLEWLQWSGLR